MINDMVQSIKRFLHSSTSLTRHPPERQFLQRSVQDGGHLPTQAVVHMQGLVLGLVRLPPGLQLVVILDHDLLRSRIEARVFSHLELSG